MDPPFVYIEEEPLSEMLRSAVDTFRRECYGHIFGKKPSRTRNSYIVNCAGQINSTSSRNKEVDHKKRSKKRVHKIYSQYPSLYPLIGDFHSHAQWGSYYRSVELSDTDIKGMTEEKWCEIAFVIRISSRSKERLEWVSKTDGGIRGTFGDYIVDVNVYRLIEDGVDLIPQSLQIISSAIKVLNKENEKKKK